MSKIAGIFCGHGVQTNGVWDSGCTYKNYTEAELCMKVTESCVKWLENSGVKVITDAPKNEINMVKQAAKSNSMKCDIHVAFHCDYDKAPAGTIPLYVSTKGRELAQKMNYYVIKDVGMKTRGLCYRSDLYELNYTDMPATIFELGSISKDLKYLRDSYEALGKACAHGICVYLGVPFINTIKTITGKVSTSATSGIVLPVRGYFTKGDKGKKVLALQKWLKAHGFSPGALDGIYGVNTVQAVKAFQKYYKISPDGEFGKKSLKMADKMM